MPGIEIHEFHQYRTNLCGKTEVHKIIIFALLTMSPKVMEEVILFLILTLKCP